MDRKKYLKSKAFRHKIIVDERTSKGILNCVKCGKELGDTYHHFYCKSCWLKTRRKNGGQENGERQGKTGI